MPTDSTRARPEDDRRHVPGPGALPLWNESFWFPFWDPEHRLGVVLRVGLLPRQHRANLFLFLVQGGSVVHHLVDHRLPMPADERDRLHLDDLVLDWEEPLRRFRLRYGHGDHRMDVVWEAVSPAYLYPHPPESTAEEYPRHLEQGGTVRGSVTIAGVSHAIEGFGHRDHSWGGERDWAKFHSWDYLSAEFGRDLWFNAVRIAFAPGADIHLGCLWDGQALHALGDIEMAVETADGGTRQVGVDVRFTDERRRPYHAVGEEVVAVCPVAFDRTWLRDGITRYRMGTRIGWGILEHGYTEPLDHS